MTRRREDTSDHEAASGRHPNSHDLDMRVGAADRLDADNNHRDDVNTEREAGMLQRGQLQDERDVTQAATGAVQAATAVKQDAESVELSKRLRDCISCRIDLKSWLWIAGTILAFGISTGTIIKFHEDRLNRHDAEIKEHASAIAHMDEVVKMLKEIDRKVSPSPLYTNMR